VWDDIWGTGVVNISPALNSAAPSYKLGWPEHTLAEHEEFARCASIVYLHQKLAGRPVFVIDFYPPHEGTPDLATKQQLLDWWTGVFLERAKLMARTAERIKAEYFGPLMVEVEVFLGQQPAVEALPPIEQARLGQQLLDQLVAAVRPLYTGRLVAHSYANDTGPDDPLLAISFAAFDEVHFSLFPMCDLALSKQVFDKQLGNYIAIVKRDQVDWGIGEFESFKHNFDCDGTGNIHDEIQHELYAEFFRRVAVIRPRPVNIGVGHWPAGARMDTWTEATKELVLSELAKLR